MINLYPIIDLYRDERPDYKLIEKCLKMNSHYMQIRMKESTDRAIIEVTEEIIAMRNNLKSNTKIIVNDNINAALESKADGIHVGQDDHDAEKIKQNHPELIVGLSTHDIGQVLEANGINLDYIGFGPVFRTLTKKTENRVVFEHVYEVAERSVHPVVFIGGITIDNIDMIPKGENIYAASISGLKELAEAADEQ